MREYDLLVIGGGLIGCSIAWQSARRGMSVLVVERGDVGREAAMPPAGCSLRSPRQTTMILFCSSVGRVSLSTPVSRRLFNRRAVSMSVLGCGHALSFADREDDEELESRHRWQGCGRIADRGG
jgi:glycine/D-amino acid oxidase-like deaminating enzyme